MIKDSYSLPRIEDTLDSLNGAVWCTSLDLKSGYWQMEMDEASKHSMAFTVGCMGFYGCDHRPINASATFQRLMDTCLGDLQLNWCLIYLVAMIVFSKMPVEHLTQSRAILRTSAFSFLQNIVFIARDKLSCSLSTSSGLRTTKQQCPYMCC